MKYLYSKNVLTVLMVHSESFCERKVSHLRAKHGLGFHTCTLQILPTHPPLLKL